MDDFIIPEPIEPVILECPIIPYIDEDGVEHERSIEICMN